MKKVYNNFIPFKGFIAMYFCGFLFIRNEYKHKLTKQVENHEAIHDKQAKRLLFLFFYLWYIIEYFLRLPFYKFESNEAYKNISFEREAYTNMNNFNYVNEMTYWSFVKFLKMK